MSFDPDCFPVELVRGQLLAMRHAGYELASLQAFDIPSEAFRDSPVPSSAHMPLALAGRIMMHCKSLQQDESYGFSSEDRVAPGHVTLLWLSSLHGSNLGEVLGEQYELASQLGSNYGFIQRRQGGISCWGFCRSSCDSDIPLALLQRNDLSHLYWWYRVACWFVGEIIPLQGVSVMGDDLGTRDIAEQLFDCPASYQSECFAIDFSDTYLTLPLVRPPGAVYLLRPATAAACPAARKAAARSN